MRDDRSKYIRGASPELVLRAKQLRAKQLRAKQLRQAMTPSEQVLWEALRDKRLGGLRFRAQHPVGQFILDFYCPSCKLVIELDGEVHERQEDRDAVRTASLSDYGLRVIRFANQDVSNDLPSVLKATLAASKKTVG